MKKSAPKRRTPPCKRNPERAAKRKKEAFGEGKADWIRGQECFVARFGTCEGVTAMGHKTVELPSCLGDIEAMHARSRGAGGTAKDLVPACAYHHRNSHTQGVRTFERKYTISLRMAAAYYDALYQLEGPTGETTP